MNYWHLMKVKDYINGAISDVRSAKDYLDNYADSDSNVASEFLNNITVSLLVLKGFVENITPEGDEED